MGMSEKIKLLCVKRKISVAELARRMDTTPQNLGNKMKRDNFTEQELLKIAEILDCTFIGYFEMNDTKEKF